MESTALFVNATTKGLCCCLCKLLLVDYHERIQFNLLATFNEPRV